MENIIQLLPEHVANQIAAGEVIQRPASVVKELLENAIDAKATEISLIIKDAGKTLIQVIDNGIGMSATDARLAFQRHATSKIRKAEDLFSLHTKGFRGEALASIAAIARVEMHTRRPDDELGTKIRIEGNEITYDQPCVAPAGTSFSVKSLFFNIPARRNFLKSDSIELRHLIDEFQRVALAHPEVHFHLYQQSSEIFNLPAGKFRQRIIQIFGKKLDTGLIPVEEKTDLINIKGYIVRPEFLRKTKQAQFFLVNRRFIKNRYLHHAVLTAYEGLIAPQVQPEYFLHIEVDPKTIDINIHPTKTEIKFENEHHIYSILKSVVRYGLGQFNAMPSLDFTKNPELELPYSYKDKAPVFPAVKVDPNFNPFKKESVSASHNRHSFSEKKPNWESLYTGISLPEQEKITFETPAHQTSLFESQLMDQSVSTFVMANKFLVVNRQEELIIIHIKRAHQRILYEQYLRSFSSINSVSQQLLFPISLEFSLADITLLKNLEENLFAMGFIFSFQDNTLVINGIPIYIKENQVDFIIRQCIENCREEIPQDPLLRNDFLAKSLCKNVIFNENQNLSTEEQLQLINHLFASENPQVSPFQKPVYTTLKINEIENKFYL